MSNWAGTGQFDSDSFQRFLMFVQIDLDFGVSEYGQGQPVDGPRKTRI